MGQRSVLVVAAAGLALWSAGSAGAEGRPAGRRAEELAAIEELAKQGNIEAARARLVDLLAGLPAQDRMIAWKRELPFPRRVTGAWRVGRFACFAAQGTTELQAIDAATGQESTWRAPGGDVWVKPLADPRRALVTTGLRMEIVDAETGVVGHAIRYVHDRRIEPVAWEDGFVAVKGSRGEALVRLSREGQELWQCRLPGYVMVHTVVHGSTLIVQTRGGSYGGQATAAVDLQAGKLLWTDRVDAYGAGAAFSEDGQFVVEADAWMCPEATEGWLIGREPRTGKRLWHHRRPGLIDHQPVVEPATHRTFALFQTGAIVCLAGKTGEVLWTARLPTTAPRSSGSSYTAYWPVLALHERTLMALDARGAVHFFEAATGRRLAAFATVSALAPDGKSPSFDDVVAMPWIDGDKLIVASTRGIAAYPVASVLAGEESLELRARALRTRLLLEEGDAAAAAAELARMQAARPASPLTLECSAAVHGAEYREEREILARLCRMRQLGLQADSRLLRLTGLVRRMPCGPQPTPPVLLGGKVFVGSADGVLRAWDATTLEPAGELDAEASITGELGACGGTLVFGTADRRVRGASLDLQPLFNWPAPDARSAYLMLGDVIVRSAAYVPYVSVAVLDLEAKRLGKGIQIDGARNPPVAHNGRLYYGRPRGGTASFDGRAVEEHPPVLPVQGCAPNASGDKPVGFGAAGLYDVDEHLRPVKLLVPTPTPVFAAARSHGVLAALSEQKNAPKRGLLEAWTEAGEKLPLRCATSRFDTSPENLPALLPLDKGFLLVARELVCLDPERKDPVWRFWPGEPQDWGRPVFRGPVVQGDKVFFTDQWGELLVFSKLRLTGAIQEF